jgi:hypothetical protein
MHFLFRASKSRVDERPRAVVHPDENPNCFDRWLVKPDSTAGFTKRALVEMQEREKIPSGEEKNEPPTARRLYVSLDRADAIIEGSRPLIPKNALAAISEQPMFLVFPF